MNYFIYGIVCPDTKIIRYIGKTKNFESRRYSHLSGNSYYFLSLWINRLKEKNKIPDFIVIDHSENKEEIDQLEKKYILEISNNNLTFNRAFNPYRIEAQQLIQFIKHG